MKVTATYVWSATVEVEVPDNASDDVQREALDEAALEVELDFCHPIIHECSNENLID
jgi:hypothetical protein